MAPFGFTGWFTFQPSWSETWERFEVQGSGIATIELRQWVGESNRAWVIDSIRYEFTAADPVPEPATLVLIGLGMTGIARKYGYRSRLPAAE